MMRLCTTGVLLLALVGCGSSGMLYKEGVSTAQARADQARCTQAAANQYPPKMVTNYISIHDRDGVFIENRPVQNDSNQRARTNATQACITDLGYKTVSIPTCSEGQLSAGNFAPLSRMPELTPNICALPSQGGAPTLIDLSKPL